MNKMIILWVLLVVPMLITIGTAIFKWLWNITMPQVFNLKMITFWQAFRLLLLAGILFGADSFVKFNMNM